MKARLYLLEGTYPSKVIIKNNLITKEYTYQNSQEFINDINNLFAINNNPDTTVILVLDPSICRNIAMDNGFGKFQLAGYNNLNNYDDIRFYRYDEKNDLEIFEDIYQKDIQSSDNKLLNLTLQKDVNLELVKKGENLIKEIKCEILEIGENKELVEYIEKDLLTDKKLIPYWVNTSSNDLIKLILKNSATVKEKIEQLLRDEEIEVPINLETVIVGIEKNEENIWGLLLGTGYLKVTEVVDLAHGIYKVKIPNYEIKFLFQNIIREWFNDKVIGNNLNTILKDLVTLNLEEFEENHPEVLIIQIDAGEYKTLTDLYKVKTAPTLLFFKNGNYLDRHQGFIEAEEIASVFENNE